MGWAGFSLSVSLACCVLSACLAFAPLSISPYSARNVVARPQSDLQRRDAAGGSVGLQMVGNSRRGRRGQSGGRSAKRSLTPRDLNRRGRGGGGRGRRQDSKDEDEDWNDETSPEIRVMKARQSGQYSIPSWAKTLEVKGHGRMIGEKSKRLEDSPYVVLREFRGGQLPEDLLDECFDMTKENMEAMYCMSSWGWNDTDKLRSLWNPSARYLVAKTLPREQGQKSHVAGFVHYRFEIEDNVETEDTDCSLYIHELQVASWAQGYGLGKRLMDVMEEFAKQSNMDKSMLTVFVYNPAFNFYTEKLGYQEDRGSKHNRYGKRNETLELSKPVVNAVEQQDPSRVSVLMLIKGMGLSSDFDAEGTQQEGRGLRLKLRMQGGEGQSGANEANEGGHDKEEEEEEEAGSVPGAALLFAGTAVGAGMIALPAETAPAGFFPSEASLAATWAFTYITSLLTLEAAWLLGGREAREGGGGGGFLSMAKQIFGPVGEAGVGIMFWYLLTCICVAYTAEGGQLFAQAGNSLQLPYATPTLGSALFLSAFAALAVGGTAWVDSLNRALMFGVISSFVCLEAVGLPLVDSSLLSRADWSMVYPRCVSIGVISFGAQNVVPTLLRYLGGDAERTRMAIAAGSIIPLLMYSAWDACFLGISANVPGGGDVAKDAVVEAMEGVVGGSSMAGLLTVFTVCAIFSSMAGASVSFVDFFEDSFGAIFGGGSQDSSTSSGGVAAAGEAQGAGRGASLTGSAVPDAGGGFHSRRLAAAACALAPVLLFAAKFEGAFLGALENAGVLGGVSLYGIVPAALVWRARVSQDGGEAAVMPGRLGGGDFALVAVGLISTCLVVPEAARIFSGLLSSPGW